MLRYEGLLRPLPRPAPYPARWVAVATEGATVPVEERPRLRQTGLRQWHALVCEMRGAEVQGQEALCGGGAHGLWEALVALSRRPGLCWCISPRALYDWTLLGLWERILLGQLAIAQSGPARPRGLGDRGLTRSPGQCMTGDPPSAALIQLGEGAKCVQWVCAGNYGWRDSLIGVEPRDCPARLVEYVVSASAALARHSLGGFAPTVGAMALRAWRSTYLKESLYVSNGERERQLLARGSFGGRIFVRAGNARADRGFWVDGRGLYARLSYVRPLPVGLRHINKRGSESLGGRGDERAATLAQVKIRANAGRYPVRGRDGPQWPSGEIETVLCGPELQHAIERGVVSEIGECHEYRMGQPLAGYQQACYALREEGEARGQAHVAALGKALAVCVIGKLAAWDETWEEVIPDYNDPICGSWLGPDERGRMVEYRATAGTVARKRRTGRAATAIPAIPLWVWSYGRVWLLDRMECAGMEEILYADTDGLVTTERGYDRLVAAGYIRDNEWGELRLLAGPIDVEVLGPKMVRIGAEVIQAGAPKAQRAGNFTDDGFWFRRPFSGGAGTYGQGVWEEEYHPRANRGGESGT